MKRIKPSVLLVGVVICAALLVLHRFGLFREMADTLLRAYQGSIIGQSATLVRVPALQYAVHTLLAFLSAWICAGLSKQWHRFAFIIGLSLLVASLSPVLAVQRVLFEPFSGVAAVMFAGLGAMIFSVSERGSRLHRFRQFFADRVREDVFDRLVEDEEPVPLAGKREITSLTCRILNASELGEALDAEVFERLSSAFLLSASEFLVANGAYLDVCNSQGITVQLGFPVADNAHALSACRLALKLRDHLKELAAGLVAGEGHSPAMGIAVSSGQCVCGLIGHGSFQFYSALGEAPEFSRRLCNMNGVYGSVLLISASTFAAVKDAVEVRPMELLAAPGHTGLHEVYELLGGKGCLSDGEACARDAFWQGVVALRQGDAEAALAHLRQALVVGKDDPPLKYFKQRAEALRKGGQSHVRQSVHQG